MSNIKESVAVLDQAISFAISQGIFKVEDKLAIFSHLVEVKKYVDSYEDQHLSQKDVESELTSGAEDKSVKTKK